MTTETTNKGRELRGWKAIAEYLKVTERTARKWADEEGMPVAVFRRGVIAFTDELDAWKKARTAPRRRRAAA